MITKYRITSLRINYATTHYFDLTLRPKVISEWIKKNEVWTNYLVEFDDHIPSGCGFPNSPSVVTRQFSMTVFLWTLKRYKKLLLRLKASKSDILLYTDLFFHFPMIMFLSLKLSFQYSLGWISGLWVNKSFMTDYIYKHGLRSRFFLISKPLLIFLSSRQYRITTTFLVEISSAFPFIFICNTLVDSNCKIAEQYNRFFPQILIDTRNLSVIYFFITCLNNIIFSSLPTRTKPYSIKFSFFNKIKKRKKTFFLLNALKKRRKKFFKNSTFFRRKKFNLHI